MGGNQRSDTILAESEMSPFVCNRSREGVRELWVESSVACLEHLEDAKRHALENDVLPNDTRNKIAPVDFLEQDLCELRQIRIGLICDQIIDFVGVDAEVDESLRKDLDVTSFIERLGRKETLARSVRRRIDQSGRCRECALLTCHELYSDSDRLFTQKRIRKNGFRLGLARFVAIFLIHEICLGTGFEPVLNRVRVEK